VDGRQTLAGYQVRVWGAGNVVADPTHNGRLYLTFSDNRNGLQRPPGHQLGCVRRAVERRRPALDDADADPPPFTPGLFLQFIY
jgi:hypothetical protein